VKLKWTNPTSSDPWKAIFAPNTAGLNQSNGGHAVKFCIENIAGKYLICSDDGSRLTADAPEFASLQYAQQWCQDRNDFLVRERNPSEQHPVP
jgi:hypothetical protein